MPKEVEKREEDVLTKEPFSLLFLKHFMKPDDESLPANSQLSSTMTTPMAEMAVMEELWSGMIAHQVVKAFEYCAELPEAMQKGYKLRIEAFQKEHYYDYPDCKKPILSSTTLRKYISLYSLSILGKHQQDSKDIAQVMIESMGVPTEKPE
jgi:hypothetical protein